MMNHRGTTEGTVMTPVGPVAISPPNELSLERSRALANNLANYTADGSRPVTGSSSSAMVPRDGERVPVPGGDSPQKAMLRTEVQQLEQYARNVAQQTRNQVVQEARDAMQSQTSAYERAAQEHEQMSRDIAEAEVAQAKARVQSQALSTIKNTEDRAEKAFAQQRAGMVDEARQAISNTKQQVIGEAETAFAERQNAFGQEYNELYRIAEDNVMQERQLKERYQAEMQAHVQREQSLRAEVAELARAQQATMQDAYTARQQVMVNQSARSDSELGIQRGLFREEMEAFKKQCLEEVNQSRADLQEEVGVLQEEVNTLRARRRGVGDDKQKHRMMQWL